MAGSIFDRFNAASVNGTQKTICRQATALPQMPEEMGGILGTLGEYAVARSEQSPTRRFAGNRVRSALVSEPGQFDRTVSGRDVLRYYGLADDEDDWVDYMAG